ncbi:UDP-diphosphatase [Paramagnetospirillum marisnigri]|uniref:Undecaprenyl-diphosphatase n=1 Tax=Paramagnetospirillum marisnigri TaxID=1285242 RepID=A0A178MPD6_9PROT|nr:undecaprenyl-diphosphate phosphatase [Paramagnetospirillum marisnigri]OAN50660.1 UDP-diphosphatase [Paramagnetospirillum marisnigri]
MTLLDVLLVALIQGLGEALPLGASGLLAALPRLAGSIEGRAALSVAAHLGILVALMLYFWRDVGAMGAGLWRLGKGKPDAGSRLLLHLALGTIPAAAAGWFLLDRVAGLVSPALAAGLVLAGGIFLLVADRLGVTVRRIEHMTFVGSLVLGAMQVLALVPGVSRTGITITLARLLGWERQSAARFSLLLAMPLIIGHAGRTFWGLAQRADLVLSSDLALAAAAAGGSALVAVAAMMAWVNRRSFAPFALARIVLGAVALALILWNGW